MRPRSTLLRWCGLCLLLILALPPCTSLRSLFDKTNLPRLADTDSIELYHLRSFPAMLIETAAGSFSTQSSGLALRSTSTNQVIVLEYKPKSYAGCFLPIIEAVDEGKFALYWDKRAELVYHDQIDTVFWQQSTFLAHINGIVYKNYVVWIQEYMQSNRLFSPQSICNSEREFNCYSDAETWETFLQDSLKVFAAYSVRIHAIIPPRATELRLLSSALPVMVQAQAVVPHLEDPSDGPHNPRRRHDGDDQSGKGGGVAPTPSGGGHLRAPVEETPSALDSGKVAVIVDPERRLRHMVPVLNADQQPQPAVNYEDLQLIQSSNTGSTSSDPRDDTIASVPVPALPSVPMEEIVIFYQDLMSCMQEFQLTDFTNALKSCISSEHKTYIHINGDRYYVFMPRYPFVYINEYLQQIPEPVFNDTASINSVDGSILVFLALIAVVGGVLMMKQMRISFCHSLCSACGACTTTSVRPVMEHYGSGQDLTEEVEALADRESAVCDRVAKAGRGSNSTMLQPGRGVISRIWGSMTWRRSPPPRSHNGESSSASRGKGTISHGPYRRHGDGSWQANSQDEVEEDESVELMRHHR